MAVKSWYLTIVDSATHKPVDREYSSRMFFTAPEMNKHIKDKELLEKYPKPQYYICLLYTSPSPRDRQKSRMPSSA